MREEHHYLLVAGIGNIFLGDDGFGCEVAQRLARRKLPPGVRVVDFGIRGFDLAYELMGTYETAILIDAIPRGGKPGTLYQIEPDLPDAADLSPEGVLDTHAMNPLRVLSLARSMSGKLPKVLLVGCEPQSFGPEEGRLGLSAPVSAAVDEALRMVESIVESVSRAKERRHGIFQTKEE